MDAKHTPDAEARAALKLAGWTLLVESSDGIHAHRGGERIRLAYTTAGRTHIYAQDLAHALAKPDTSDFSRGLMNVIRGAAIAKATWSAS